jgi:hypothetical protein
VLKLVAGLALAALCAASTPVRAEPARDRAEATRRAGLGKSLYDIGKYQRAIEEFEAAYLLYPTDRLLYNLAQAHRKADNCKKALEYYLKFLERSSDLRLRGLVIELLPELRQACGITSAPPTELATEDARGERPTSFVAERSREPARVAVRDPAPARLVETPEPAADDAVDEPPARVRLTAAAAFGSLFNGGGNATSVGVAARAELPLHIESLEPGAAVQIDSAGWANNELSGRSTLIRGVATIAWSRSIGGTVVGVEASAGVAALTGLVPSHPLRQRGAARGGSVAVGPMGGAGLLVRRAIGAEWKLRGGAHLATAAIGDAAGGVLASLSVTAGVEYTP